MGKVLMLLALMLCLNISRLNAAENDAILKIPLQNSTVSLDPAHIQDVASLFVSRQINCQLVRNIGSKYDLDIASSIKYISQLVIEIKIKNNVRFQDGSLITANDVVASFEYIKKSRTVLRNIFMWVDNIAIVDNNTIIFKLKKPIPKFLTVLSSPNYAIFKASFMKEAAKNHHLWEYPIGCGGYKIANRDDRIIHLLPVGSGLPVDFYLNQSDDSNFQMKNNYDIINDKYQHKDMSKYHYSEIQIFDPSQVYIGLNLTKSEWKNKAKRCNFLSKIDISALLNKYGNYAIPANDFFPVGALGYDESTNFFLRYIDRFKNKPTNSSENICLTYLSVSMPDKYIDAYKLMLSRLSSNIRVNKMTDSKRFGISFSSSNCDVLVFSLKSNYLDGYEYLQIFANNDANFSGLANHKFSQEIKDSQDFSDAAERAKQYRNIANKVEESCMLRPLITIPIRYIYVKRGVNTPGIGRGPLNEYYLGGVTKDA